METEKRKNRKDHPAEVTYESSSIYGLLHTTKVRDKATIIFLFTKEKSQLPTSWLASQKLQKKRRNLQIRSPQDSIFTPTSHQHCPQILVTTNATQDYHHHWSP